MIQESLHAVRTRITPTRNDDETLRFAGEIYENCVVDGPAICHAKNIVVIAFVKEIIASAVSVRMLDGRMRDSGVHKFPSWRHTMIVRVNATARLKMIEFEEFPAMRAGRRLQVANMR